MLAHRYGERLARRDRGRRGGKARSLASGENKKAGRFPLNDEWDTQERLRTVRRVHAAQGPVPRETSMPPATAQRLAVTTGDVVPGRVV